jgi:hypothetical protein
MTAHTLPWLRVEQAGHPWGVKKLGWWAEVRIPQPHGHSTGAVAMFDNWDDAIRYGLKAARDTANGRPHSYVSAELLAAAERRRQR